MVNCNVRLSTIICCIGIICSVCIIAGAADAIILGHVRCTDPMPGLDMTRGVWMLILTILGLLCEKWPNKIMQGIYISFLVLFLIALIFLMGALAFGTTNKEAQRPKSDEAYDLHSYSSWLKHNLVNEDRMEDFIKCAMEKKVCKEHIYTKDMWEHPIEIGCCNPPTSCGFQNKNGTWVMPETGVESHDMDCVMWDGQGDEYCYDCDSCSASIIAVFLRYWYFRDFVCFVYAIILLSCFAFTIHHDH